MCFRNCLMLYRVLCRWWALKIYSFFPLFLFKAETPTQAFISSHKKESGPLLTSSLNSLSDKGLASTRRLSLPAPSGDFKLGGRGWETNRARAPWGVKGEVSVRWLRQLHCERLSAEGEPSGRKVFQNLRKSEAPGKETLFGFVHAVPFTEATQDQKWFEFLLMRVERA